MSWETLGTSSASGFTVLDRITNPSGSNLWNRLASNRTFYTSMIFLLNLFIDLGYFLRSEINFSG